MLIFTFEFTYWTADMQYFEKLKNGFHVEKLIQLTSCILHSEKWS